MSISIADMEFLISSHQLPAKWASEFCVSSSLILLFITQVLWSQVIQTTMQSDPGNQEYNLLMSTAYLLFLGRLRDFLPHNQREQFIRVDFRGRQSIKHLAESLGVPHPETGRVRVNGQEAALSTITQDGDQVELHPVPNECPVEPHFLLDKHLGRLAAYLRMLGFDCLYEN